MNPEELSEQAEHAHHAGQKAIGLTTAITAVLLALRLYSVIAPIQKRSNCKPKVNDQWGFYQANTRERTNMERMQR